MEGLKGKRIIVTGGAGFIGSHLIEKLIKVGAVVFVIDRYVSPLSYFVKKEFYQKTKLALTDISDRHSISQFFAEFKPEYIFHLAAEAIVTEAYLDPYKTFQSNVMGTISILEAAKRNSVKGIIVASSDKAYGKTKEAYSENSPLKGDHPYDVSKTCTDLIAHTYYKTYNMPIVVTRFGNVYGEGDLHFDRIIPGIYNALIKKKKLLIRSDGTYIRDYIYVKDVVSGYLFLLKNLSKIKGEAFNFSPKDTFSVIDLVKEIESSLKTKIHYKIMNTAKNEIPYQHLNDMKVRALGWKSRYTVKNTAKDIFLYYKTVV